VFKDNENVGSPRNFFQKIFISIFFKQILKKEDATLLATGFATVSQIANHCQIPRCITKFVTIELTNVTSQGYIININHMWKY